MPPTMITGIRSAGPAALNARQISAREARSEPESQPVFFPYQMQTATSAAAEMSAGISPDIDSVRIDTPEMNA